MKYFIPTIIILGLSAPSVMASTTTVEQLLENYRRQGAHEFDHRAGEKFWHQSFRDKKSGKMRSCTSCHTQNLRKPGRHVKTRKRIEPLSPAIHPGRLSDVGKIRKWFRRNCKWTLGRECTAQEKGNVLLYLQSQ